MTAQTDYQEVWNALLAPPPDFGALYDFINNILDALAPLGVMPPEPASVGLPIGRFNNLDWEA